MAPGPEVFRPVDVEGELRLGTPSGDSLNLVADGETLRVDLPSWTDTHTVLPRSFRGRRHSLRFVADVLTAYGVTLSVELAGRPVLRLGYGTVPSLLARLLGLAPAYIPFSAVRVLFRR